MPRPRHPTRPNGDLVSSRTPAFAVDLVHGSVTVAGHDETYIELVVTRRTQAATDAERADADREVRLDIVEGPDGVSLCASMPYRPRCDDPDSVAARRRPRPAAAGGPRVAFHADLRKVPRASRVTAKTIDGDTLRLGDLDGPIEVRHVNGGIEATGLSRSLRLR